MREQYSRADDGRDYLVMDPIQITSPEQFVPLFLIRRSPVLHKKMWAVGTRNRVIIHCSGYSSDSREEVKRELLEQLNHSYPDKYALEIYKSRYDCYSNHSMGIAKHVTGAFNDGEEFQLEDIMVDMGLVIKLHPSLIINHPQLNTSLYKQATTYWSMDITKIRPQFLIVIKAKHIPRLRSRYYLKQNYELDNRDIKVLWTKEFKKGNDFGTIMYSRYMDKFNEEMSNGLARYEVVSSQEIASYLYPPIDVHKTYFDYLKDAKRIAETENVR